MDRERKNMKEALAPPESKGSDEDNDNDNIQLRPQSHLFQNCPRSVYRAPKLMSFKIML